MLTTVQLLNQKTFTSRNRSCSGAVPRLPYVTQVIQIGFGPEDQFGIRNHCEPDLRDVVQYVDGDTPERPPRLSGVWESVSLT